MFSLRSKQVKIACCDRWGLAVYQVNAPLPGEVEAYMWESISAFIGFVLSVTVTTMIARRVNASSGRARALVAGLLASAAISIISDFTLACFAQGYDRSLEAVTSRSLVAALIGLVIAFFITLKSRTAA